MPSTSTVSTTGTAPIDGVLTGTKWATSTLTFSFPASGSYYGSGYGSGEPNNNFEAFTPVQQEAVRSILKMVSSVTNLNFTEVIESSTVHGDLRYAESDSTSTAWAYYPHTSDVGGDAWFNNSKNWYDAPTPGTYGYHTMMHETGHALGLKHPHEASGAFSAMPAQFDSIEYTVMSYRSFVGASTTSGYSTASTSYPTTLMMYDIAALQHMYGADYTTNAGNTIYRWDPATGRMSVDGIAQASPAGNKIFMTLWDGGGTDTYDLSNYATNLKIDLSPGGWSTFSEVQRAELGYGNLAKGNVANALLHQGNKSSLIENAIGGSGADSIIGNDANNVLTGGAGNDVLDGGAGIDVANYLGTTASYSWSRNADGSWRVTDLRAGTPDGIDTLWRIETLRFADGSVALDGGTLVSTNSAPVITSAAASATLTEWMDKSADETANTLHVATGTITYTDADALDLHTARVTAQGGGYLGSLTLDTSLIDSGDRIAWRFAVDDRTIDYLKAGQSLTQRYDVTIDDGRGGTAMQTLTISLLGTDDAVTKTAKGGKGRGGGAEPDDQALFNARSEKVGMSGEQAPAPLDSYAGPLPGVLSQGGSGFLMDNLFA
jgi:serralysin